MKLNIVNFQKFQNIGHKFQKNQPFNLIDRFKMRDLEESYVFFWDQILV